MRRGVTFIEIVIVIAIILVLIAMVLQITPLMGTPKTEKFQCVRLFTTVSGGEFVRTHYMVTLSDANGNYSFSCMNVQVWDDFEEGLKYHVTYRGDKDSGFSTPIVTNVDSVSE